MGIIRKSLGAITLTAGILLATAPSAETLRDTLVQAYKHSGLLDRSRALLRAADEDVAVALAQVRPIIGWSSSATISRQGALAENRSANLSVTADMVLYDFGRNQLAIEAAKETVLATREALTGVEQQVFLSAVAAYMNTRRATEFVALRRNNVRVITEQLRAARDRFEVGEVTRTDVAQAEARLAEARNGLASAEGDLRTQREVFRAAVGRYPGALAAPRGVPKTAKSIEGAKSTANRMHPSMKEAQRNITIAELNVQRAKAAMRPQLNLRGSLGVADGGSTSKSLSLQAQGTIYRGGELSARLRQAMARRDASRAALHITRHDVSREVGSAYSRVLTARASLQSSEQQIRAARVAFRGVREEATLGARTTLDVLNAEQALLDAQAARLAAAAEEQIAAYTLLSSMGLLTVDHLNLNVTRYDPAAYYNLVKDAPVPLSKQGQQLDRVLKSLGKK